MPIFKIIIATTTRNRPKMLINLYKSLSGLEIPSNIDVEFLIVENNRTSTSENWLHEIRSSISPSAVVYILETSIGISCARNRALDYTQEAGADFLAFVDDDEFVEPDWLKQLFAEQQRRDLDLVGSPVRPVPQNSKLSLWQRFVWSGVERNGTRAEDRARRKWQENKADTIKIATGSWLGRIDFFRRTGLRFDSKLGLTGGEDWNLWLEAKKHGAKTGWAPDAIVYETVPHCRISFSYHFRRNRDHNATEFTLLYSKSPRRAWMRLPSRILSRVWKLLTAILTLPFRGGQALISLAMALGGIVGLVQACCGKQQLHYKETTGS
ncbi:glycosyltransferase [Brucella sp. BO3]|uniref:glycosyltransferase family 2 protein n=1 Tax=Brucella sp. BO3 TaxID=2691913 RepID=UPI0015F4B205|nr:glycosyltransferase [Brucella sp. BO3]QMV26347.1 glycosyltransferase [Brucella sp. BO3]